MSQVDIAVIIYCYLFFIVINHLKIVIGIYKVKVSTVNLAFDFACIVIYFYSNVF